MTTYSLTVVNNEQISGSFAVFQNAPPISVPGNVFALAWAARLPAPSSSESFNGGINYSFVRSETGMLQSGIGFSAGQNLAADPNGQNIVQLTQDGLSSEAPADNGATEPLTVQQPSNVVPNRTSVGIGMSGSGTFAVQAAPNMKAVFTPHPNYWVTFGNYQTSDVMDIRDTTSDVKVPGDE